MNQTYHIPVLPEESIAGLKLRPGSDVVDATFGGGGHARLMLSNLGNGRLFAFDQDPDASQNVFNDDRLFFIGHNFRYMKNFLRFLKAGKIDSIFADLGVSSHDFDVAERGFSYRLEGNLDMRMNTKAKTNAATVINQYTQEQLAFVFKMYGEIQNAGRLASEVMRARNMQPLKTTGQLKKIALACAPKNAENKYLAQVFQALRIEVNDEMEALKEFLVSTLDILKSGGRLVIITYHSLEDRLCKNFMKTGNFEGIIKKDFFGNVITPFRLINRKVTTPGSDELTNNPRSRSAKLRIAERL